MNKSYDVCLSAISCPDTDARTLNMARTFAAGGFKTLLVAGNEINCGFSGNSEKFDFLPITISAYRRAYRKWLSFHRQMIGMKKLIKADNIIACDLFALPACSAIAEFSNSKLFYDSREIYSAMGPLAGQAFKQKIISAIEKKYVKNVSEFIVSGALDADYLAKYFNTQKKFNVIMNVPPFKQHVKSNLIREKYGISENDTVILYQGAILPGRGLAEAIDAIGHDENAVLCIIGDGEYANTIKQKITELKLSDRVFFTGKIPYDELHSWTCSADIGLALFKPVSYSYELALPNKLFEYCMANIPTIATDLPAIKKIIDTDKIAELVPVDLKITEIQAAIEKLRNKNYSYEIKNNCEFAAKKFCYENQAQELINMIENK